MTKPKTEKPAAKPSSKKPTPAKSSSAAPPAAIDLDAVRALAKAETPPAWEHADDPLLVGLERWGTALATKDALAGARVLVATARRGFSIIAERSVKPLADLGFFGKESDPIMDGASVEVQLARVAAWLEAPSAEGRVKIAEAFDPTRQLMVWSEDLMPRVKESFFWYLDLGQLACASVLHVDKKLAPGGDDDEDYYAWSAPACVGRGLVVAVRGLAAYEQAPSARFAMLFA